MSTTSVSVAARAGEAQRPAAPAQPPLADTQGAQGHGVGSAIESTRLQRKSGKRKLASIVVGLAVLLAAGGYWYTQRAIESTDDAQIDADVIAVPARTSGTVRTVHFAENQQVVADQLLAELDDAPAQAKLAQAEAQLTAAEAAAHAADVQAQLAQTNAKSGLAVATAGLRTSSVGAQSSLAQIAEEEARVENAKARLAEASLNFSRTSALFQSGAVSSAQLDQQRTAQEVARTELARTEAALANVKLVRDQAESRVLEARARLSQSDQVDALIREATARAQQAHAAVETARAQRTLAALELSYTKIYAPHAGVVSKKNVNIGQNVALGQSIVQLVPSERWVTANFKETQVDHMRVGQPVKVSVDAYPEHALTGHVASFSGATGSRFALLPPDNATGNFTKVVQRLSVRVQLDELPPELALRPGMSVEVRVDTQGQPVAQTEAPKAAADQRTASVSAPAPALRGAKDL
ncbi:MAG: HlyD family secretion protein [Polyangiales bacterium]